MRQMFFGNRPTPCFLEGKKVRIVGEIATIENGNVGLKAYLKLNPEVQFQMVGAVLEGIPQEDWQGLRKEDEVAALCEVGIYTMTGTLSVGRIMNNCTLDAISPDQNR